MTMSISDILKYLILSISDRIVVYCVLFYVISCYFMSCFVAVDSAKQK